jgi:hypothetical protein
MYLDNNFFSNAPFCAGYSEDDEIIQVELSEQQQHPRSEATSSPFPDGGYRRRVKGVRINGEKKKKEL